MINTFFSPLGCRHPFQRFAFLHRLEIPYHSLTLDTCVHVCVYERERLRELEKEGGEIFHSQWPDLCRAAHSALCPFQTIHRLTVSPLSLSASGIPGNIPHRFMRPRFRIKHQSGKKTGQAVFLVMVWHARQELNHAPVAWPRCLPSPLCCFIILTFLSFNGQNRSCALYTLALLDRFHNPGQLLKEVW